MATWQELAAALVDYHPGNQWERMLERHLRQFFPELVSELASNLPAYLSVQTASAMDLAERLEDQGTPPDAARELALSQLLPTPPDELEQPTRWEAEEALARQDQAALQQLLSTNRPQRTIRPT